MIGQIFNIASGQEITDAQPLAQETNNNDDLFALILNLVQAPSKQKALIETVKPIEISDQSINFKKKELSTREISWALPMASNFHFHLVTDQPSDIIVSTEIKSQPEKLETTLLTGEQAFTGEQPEDPNPLENLDLMTMAEELKPIFKEQQIENDISNHQRSAKHLAKEGLKTNPGQQEADSEPVIVEDNLPTEAKNQQGWFDQDIVLAQETEFTEPVPQLAEENLVAEVEEIEQQETFVLQSKETIGQNWTLEGKNETGLVSKAPEHEQLVRPQELPKYILKQLESNLKTNRAQGTSEVTIRLKPESLGRILLHLSTAGDELTVKIFTENNVAKHLLEQNMPQLRQALEDQGLRNKTIEVEVGADPQGQLFNQQKENSSPKKHNYQAHRARAKYALGLEEETLQMTIGHGKVGLGSIEILA